MKYIYSILAVFLLSQPVLSQDVSSVKIGVVDIQKLITESPQAQDMQTAIEEEYAPRVRDIEAKESAFNETREKLQKDNLALSNDERQNTQLQLQRDQRELEFLIKSVQEDQQTSVAIESNKILVEIIQEVNKLKLNVVVGMYHDQILPTIKALFKFKAINITLGLPFARVSPDHGVASNIMGKKIADPSSLIECLKFLSKKK